MSNDTADRFDRVDDAAGHVRTAFDAVSDDADVRTDELRKRTDE